MMSRAEPIDERRPALGRVLREFRFGTHISGGTVRGWSVPRDDVRWVDVRVVFHGPSEFSQGPVDWSRRAPCTSVTTLVDVSPDHVRFTDQTWYFSERACQAALGSSEPEDVRVGPDLDLPGVCD